MPPFPEVSTDEEAGVVIRRLAAEHALDVSGGRIRRTSSRFCLGVEHGDYNGTELFGVGTDRFIWMAYKPNTSGRLRLFHGKLPGDGVVEFSPGNVPPPLAPGIKDTWARFPFGVDHVLRREGLPFNIGMDAVLYANIPGGGMSRSASLTLNLILTLLEINGAEIKDPLRIVDLAQAVENDYIGSPCGQLDQIMILFARQGRGTHYLPATREIRHVPLGPQAGEFRIAVMDTGTLRPGLEKSTYKIRRAECEELVALLQKEGRPIRSLADIREVALYEEITNAHAAAHPALCRRLKYLFFAQQRFGQLLDAWKAGDIHAIGSIFRRDGLGLRDDYQISGPELESMCDIARTVPGVLGERMLGGGDKGAVGALLVPEAVDPLRDAVATAYPRSHPEFAEACAVHTCRMVDGVKLIDGML